LIRDLIINNEIDKIKELFKINKLSYFLKEDSSSSSILYLSFIQNNMSIFELLSSFGLVEYNQQILEEIINYNYYSEKEKIKYINILIKYKFNLSKTKNLFKIIIDNKFKLLFNYFLQFKNLSRKIDNFPILWYIIANSDSDFLDFYLNNDEKPINYNTDIIEKQGNETIWEYLLSNHLNNDEHTKNELLDKITYLLVNNVNINILGTNQNNILQFFLVVVFPSKYSFYHDFISLIVNNTNIDLEHKNIYELTVFDILEDKKNYFDNEFQYMVFLNNFNK